MTENFSSLDSSPGRVMVEFCDGSVFVQVEGTGRGPADLWALR